MTDNRQPTFGLRPPVQVEALPADHPRVQEWVAKIAALSTPVRELAADGSFRQWIDADRKTA
jgi:hypothetical protein